MANETQMILLRAQPFFDKVDADVNAALDSEDRAMLDRFLEEYVKNYPTLGDYVYQYLYDSNPKLNGCYTDYTLSSLKPSITNAQPTEDYIKFYNDKIIKPLLKEKRMTVKDCHDPDLKLFRDHWRDHLAIKGCELMNKRGDAAANVRNTVFHLAFGLGFDLTRVTTMLTKCLLMPDINPKNHKEFIYFWCLKRGISYTDMVENYIQYYNSLDVDTLLETRLASLPEGQTLFMEDQMENLTSEALFKEYLGRIKLSSKKTIRRTTPQALYWANFLAFPVEVYSPQKTGKPLSIVDLWLEEAVSQYEELLGIHSEEVETANKLTGTAKAAYLTKVLLNRSEKITEEDNILFRLEILKRSRELCYEAYKGSLPNSKLLKDLFSGIEYTQSIIQKRKLDSTLISRNEMLATMFIGFFSDEEYLTCRDQLNRQERKDLFEQQISDDLFTCGLHTFYERNPFELFLLGCFLDKDPLAYFLACWEAALKA